MDLARIENKPVLYEAACSALAECVRVDECQAWKAKAAALKEYGRQAKDDTIVRHAARIQARAIRRMGELLKELSPSAGKSKIGVGTTTHQSERDRIAREAGLSTEQKHQALRVANVPARDFDLMVDAERPATISELAERGKRPAPKPILDLQGIDPKDFQRATSIQGALLELDRELKSVPPDVVARGLLPRETRALLGPVKSITDWLMELQTLLERRAHGDD